MKILEVDNLTRDYGSKQGIFNISFEIRKGEIVGFLGANGAGKTTTIRHLMGFLKTNNNVSIFGLDSFNDAAKIQEQIGYLAGEPVFLDNLTGIEFIDLIFRMKKLNNEDYKNELIKYWELNSNTKISKMSKGMKQKVALVIAFMGDAPFIILDEPTSGLDPLMQRKFVHLINKAKQEGKTILISSHMFKEIEHTCDRILMIKDGKLVANENLNELRNNLGKYYELSYAEGHDLSKLTLKYPGSIITGNNLSFTSKDEVKTVLKELVSPSLIDINIRPETLEEVFMKYYGDENYE
ncbi:MAG: ABC transporter ATP-binding protein [Erysipelothrix sp.]|nr:ABC transporter ATP-binding protein [Erysipelothrix sp.]